MTRFGMFFTLITCLTLLSMPIRAQSAEPQGEVTDHGSFLIGAGLGTPAGVSLIAGYDFGPLALRVSGGGWSKGWYGGEGDLAVRLYHGVFFAHGISLVAGRYATNPLNAIGETEHKSQKYLGVTYDMFLSGFFLQAGLAFGKGDYPGVDGMFQFGYLLSI